MKILLLSQVFYPDVVAVSQYVADLGVELSSAHHEVSVVCSSRGYDDPTKTFLQNEVWNGIRIRRVGVWGLGKKSKLRRILSFASFFVSSAMALIKTPRQDVVVVVPPPPLLSVMAALFVQLKGGRLLYWTMDLNPDEAIAAGWMKPESISARLLEGALRYSLRASTSIVVLDRFMKDRIVARRISEDKVHVIPPWSHDQVVSFDPKGRESFRKLIGVDDKFVVMYSGNHSPLHPLDTILQAALQLKNNPAVAFVFVGGGSEFQRVKAFGQNHKLCNVICLPYLPLEDIAASLSAADLQVVLLGDSFVGIVHPCKIYNILAVGSPFLYIGPTESHISDLRRYPGIARLGQFVRHGDVAAVVTLVAQMGSDSLARRTPRPDRPTDLDCFSQRSLASSLVELIDATGRTVRPNAIWPQTRERLQ